MADMRRFWKKIRHRLEVLGMDLLVWGIPKLSRSEILALARFAGDVVFAIDLRGRRVALANLDAAFGDNYLPSEKNRIARDSFRNLARTFLDLFWASGLSAPQFLDLLDIQGREHFDFPLPPGEGRIFYSAHFGNFEWLSLFWGAIGMDAVVVGQDIKNPAVTPYFNRARSHFGLEFIPKERAVLRIFKALKRGGTCGFLVDLSLKLDQPGTIVEHFGRKKWGIAIHHTLGKMTGARLLPIVCLPLEDGRYEIRALPEIAIDNSLSETENVQRCWAPLDTLIRERPECWLWLYKHWRYRPEGGGDYPFYAQANRKFDKKLAQV